jgi:hypothetical protein
MKNLKMKATVRVGLCVILTMVFASSAVYAGVNPPTEQGFHWIGPSFVVDVIFTPAEAGDEIAPGVPCDVNGVVLSGTGQCGGLYFDLPISGEPRYFGYCTTYDFSDLVEEELAKFLLQSPQIDDLIPSDCFPRDPVVDRAQVQVLRNFNDSLPDVTTVTLRFLFWYPK